MDQSTRCEPLGGGRLIYVSDTHTFGTDAFMLADFAAPRQRDKAVDLGTGCGIIPTIWLGKGAVHCVLGIDISQEACSLALDTARANGDTVRFEVMCHDMRRLKGMVTQESFDLVVCNPPYFTPQSGYIAPEPERAQARTELSCTIDDVCAAARYLLRYGGRLCVCHRPERLCDLICAMRAAGIEPKRMRMVQRTSTSAPWLVLVEGKRGGKNTLVVEPPLIMTGPDGSNSAELEAMYGIYRDGRNFK